jgi:hypothetical protein
MRVLDIVVIVISLLLLSSSDARTDNNLIADQIKAGLSNYCDKFMSIRGENASVSPTTILKG